jgi:hypothetical protein
MSEAKKKGSKPVSPTDVAKQLQTTITKVGTLPKGIHKMTEAKKTERRFATDTQESE